MRSVVRRNPRFTEKQAERDAHGDMLRAMISQMRESDDDEGADSKSRLYFYKFLLAMVLVSEKFMVVQDVFFHVQSRQWFGTGVTLLIVANTALMAAESHGMSATTRNFLDTANVVLTWAFTAEMLVK
jgi:hypothetical protein